MDAKIAYQKKKACAKMSQIIKSCANNQAAHKRTDRKKQIFVLYNKTMSIKTKKKRNRCHEVAIAESRR